MNTWKRIGLACLTLAALGLAPADAASPRVTVKAAAPSSAYQGETLDVVVTGSGFDRSAKVQYFVSGTTNPGGITVTAVRYANSGELTTTLVVSSDADLANFDIQVTLDSGRKGKGTSLFSVMAKPTNPNETPTYPPGRLYHSFAGNGGTTAATSRLYMFGGMKDWSGASHDDLCAYTNAGSGAAAWTFIPGGTAAPGPRNRAGWSCGGGHCVLVNGLQGAGWVKETWVFSESTQTWSQVSCQRRRVLCPSERMVPAMAYDPVGRVHVMFGGDQWTLKVSNDMYVLDAERMTWTEVTGIPMPSPRSGAVATYVPGVGVVLSAGWGEPCCVTTLNDLHVWDGVAWEPVVSVLADGATGAIPALAIHNIAWDSARDALVVAGGVSTSWHTPNDKTWYVTFARSGGQWQATWRQAFVGCQAAAGSPPDAEPHAEARMALDAATQVQVFFGGPVNGGESAYDNTVECR